MTIPRLRTLCLSAVCAAMCASTGVWAQPYTSDPAGSSSPASFTNMQPTLGITYLVSTQGEFPSRSITVDGASSFSSPTQLASIRMFAGSFAPTFTLKANGALESISSNFALFSLLGTTYGGDGENTYALPNLTNTVSVNAGRGPGLRDWRLGANDGNATNTLGVNNLPSHDHDFLWPNPTAGVRTTRTTETTGGSQSFSNTQPTLATTFAIALNGSFPSPNIVIDGGVQNLSSEPLIGSVGQFAGNFAPRGWAEADGRLLQVQDNPALFSLIGTTYGGDGESTFALPDLRGRTPVHPGTAQGQSTNWSLGAKLGSDSVILSEAQMPAHNHELTADPARSTFNAGGNQSFSNLQPGLGINYIINLDGVDPESSGGLEPVLGEMTLFAGTFAPEGWAFADGQLLAISEHEDLFPILGTTYGGDGNTTFALPDMKGRTGVHAEGLDLGDWNGVDRITLTEANLPEHTHEYVPEPSSLALLALGGIVLARRRRD